MNLEKALNNVFLDYGEYADMMIGLSFIREPFAHEFREAVALTDDKQYVEAFKAFMGIAHDTFRCNDYLEARTTAEKAFRLFYEQQRYPASLLDEEAKAFVVSFFNQHIDEYQFQWEEEHQGEEMPDAAADDISNLYLARLFSVIPYKAKDEAFCESIGVRYHYEQLHMCVWFSSQITRGSGPYSRDEINYSARTTYNRLLNPSSLLWIGVVMGADKASLTAAAEELKGKRTNAARCGAVRKHVPFDTILKLYQEMMTAD